MAEVDVIKVRTSSRAKAKAKGKGKKSKAKAKAGSSASVVVKFSKDGKGKKERQERQQPIIIQNTYAPPPISFSDSILSRQNQYAPMRMADSQPFAPSTTDIPSSIPSSVPVGQAVQTHRSNTLNNSLAEIESDYRDFRSEVMSEYAPDTAERVLTGVRGMLDEFRNQAPNLPLSAMPNNLLGNNPIEDVINRMSQMSTSQQSPPTADMGGDSSSSSSSPPPPPPQLQLPAPNPNDAGVVEEPMTSIQDSNSPQSMQSVQPLQQLQLEGNPQPLALPGIPSNSSLSSDNAPTSSSNSYNPLFDDFEESVGTTQVVQGEPSVGTTQVVQGEPSVGATQVVQGEDNVGKTEVVQGEDVGPSRRRGPPTGTTYEKTQCPICGKMISSTQLERHIRTHT